jgi:hypothetical protein
MPANEVHFTTFTVNSEQSIVEVIRQIENLPHGCCKFICKNSSYPHQTIYAKANGDGWRKTGTKQGQNIYTYFSNIDTSRGSRYRWKIIKDEMELSQITEITVKVVNH